MEFLPLYFGDRLALINPHGTVGVVTLWSKLDYVQGRFREAGVDLNPATSPIAVFGTLYGNGLREMLRNLLYNPQIQTLLICGNNRSGSYEELRDFFELGLELMDSSLVRYKSPAGAAPVCPARIRGTRRLLDDLVGPENFPRPPRLVWVGDPKEVGTLSGIRGFFNSWKPEAATGLTRLEVPLPEVELTHFPSNPRAHQIIKDTPLEAWIELLYLITRFGRLVTLKKGKRIELQNVKVVVEKPKFDREDKLRVYNIDSEKLRRYQKDILRRESRYDKESLMGQTTLIPRVELRPDETYNYGHRLREYFKIDALAACVRRLKADQEDRKAYFALWDSRKDLDPQKKEGHPCFVSMFFRKFEGSLTFTATFRTHNALDGWLLNFYGLMAIQKWVSNKVELKAGPITVISHSISVDPRELDRALTIVGKLPFKVRLDPMGYFRVAIDNDEILVEHRYEDLTLKEYRGKKAVALQHQIARDLALSDLSHAIYLGRQLARAELALKEGRPFVQD
jgi:thymidylate synthase